jgi:ribonuclease VapC
VIVDTSAIVAILRREPEGPAFFDRVVEAGRSAMSAAALLETTIAIEGRGGRQAGADLDDFLARAGVEIVALRADTARLAREAWRIRGKGNHPARLNLGDGSAYLARTDVRRAV